MRFPVYGRSISNITKELSSVCRLLLSSGSNPFLLCSVNAYSATSQSVRSFSWGAVYTALVIGGHLSKIGVGARGNLCVKTKLGEGDREPGQRRDDNIELNQSHRWYRGPEWPIALSPDIILTWVTLEVT